MKQNEIYSYIYNFISNLAENQDLFSSIEKIILFGSAARGDFDKESDVDLFIEIKDISKEKDIIKLIEKELNKFDVQTQKTWALRGLNLPIKIIVGSLKDEKWKDLREDILGYAKVLYNGFNENPANLQHYFLITYDMSQTIQSKKMAFLRSLSGYTSIKKRKKYVIKGLLEKIQGKRVGAQAILLPKQVLPEIKKLLKEYKISYVIKEVWMK